MPDLIVIVGPPASGKAAIGLALSDLTGFRFFHNHMTAEPVAALFGWGTPTYGKVLTELRMSLLKNAIDQDDMPSIIFTFVWAFNLEDDNRSIAQLVQLFESKGQKVYFVELLASPQARIAREGTPLRLRLKPAKHDVERSKALHAEADSRYRMNSLNDFPYPRNHIVVDSEAQSPAEAAEFLVQHFGFPRARHASVRAQMIGRPEPFASAAEFGQKQTVMPGS